jgi:transcriptional regulator with XRE-family HTH domain
MQFISNRLIGARKAKGLSQQELADRADASLRAVQNWEAGIHEPQAENLRNLSEALGVSISYLIGGEEKAMGRREEALREHGGESGEEHWRRRALEAERRLEELRNGMRLLLQMSSSTPATASAAPQSNPGAASSVLPQDFGDRVERALASGKKKGRGHPHREP